MLDIPKMSDHENAVAVHFIFVSTLNLKNVVSLFMAALFIWDISYLRGKPPSALLWFMLHLG